LENKMPHQLVAQFTLAAENVGAEVHTIADQQELAAYLGERIDGALLLAPCPSLERLGLLQAMEQAGLNVMVDNFREQGAAAVAGLSGANFGIAATGTVVLESTAESVRIATTLPEKHFVLLDPQKILETADQAVPLLHKFHQQLPQAYLAYITGPSRTADIERVLTIGVHGPSELHILLMEGLSDDPMER
jgi:L-lactate dehydrogenase complex protein LldG